MSVEKVGNVIYLSEMAGLEDAELLTGMLDGGDVVDLSGARSLHTAVVQALLAFRPVLRGRPTDAFTANWLMPLLQPPGRNSEPQ